MIAYTDPVTRASPGTRRHQAGPKFGDRRRAHLLTALHRLLETQSLASISVADIARAAEVTRQAFYFYFPSKAAAVAELLGDIYTDIFRVAPWFDQRDGDSLAQLRAGIEASTARWRASAGLMVAMLDAVGSDPEVRTIWTGWVQEFEERATARISSDRDQGIARTDMEPPALARVLVGCIFQAMERDVRDIQAGNPPTEHLAATVFDVWRRAAYKD